MKLVENQIRIEISKQLKSPVTSRIWKQVSDDRVRNRIWRKGGHQVENVVFNGVWMSIVNKFYNSLISKY